MYEEDFFYMYWLASTGVIGIETYEKIINTFGSAKRLYYSDFESWAKAKIFQKGQIDLLKRQKLNKMLSKDFESLQAKKITMLTRFDERFPKKLLYIPNAPICLFIKGRIPDEGEPMASIVGARECSYYGEEVAAKLGSSLAGYGITVVSGMARGVDSISEIAALRAGGKSIAVLGSGVDVIYPKESLKLYRDLEECGTIMSEYVPGTQCLPLQFAMRNRIISGLSDVVCVVEARRKSGTLITVDAALEQGREVAAVPGRINDETSRGCNELIRQGAIAITNIDEFAKECAKFYKLKVKNKKSEQVVMDLDPLEKVVYKASKEDSFLISDLEESTGLEAQTLFPICFSLVSKGKLQSLGGARFKKCH